MFDCYELASILNNAAVEDIKPNKVLKILCKKDIGRFPELSNSKGYKFIAYNDVSYANLIKDGGSQGGYLIVMT